MIEFSERMPTLTPVDLDGSWSLQDRWTTTQMRRSVSSAVIGRASPAVARAEVGVRVGGGTRSICYQALASCALASIFPRDRGMRLPVSA